MKRGFIILPVFVILTGIFTPTPAETPQTRDRIVLADFSHYPEGWKARGSQWKADDIYQVIRDEEGTYLRTDEQTESVRIFKKGSWDSKAYPYIEWKWRVKKWPETVQARVALYVSLDKDFFGIPAIIKYIWSRDVTEGTVKEGGFFRPTEVIKRSGPSDSNDWIVERVNARADFHQLLGREPREQAYGIGLLTEAGMVVEIGEIVALKNPAVED